MIKTLSFLTARMDAKLAVVLVLTGLLPLLVAGWLGLHFASQTLRQQVMSNLQVVAESKAQRIEDYLLSRVRDVSIQSRSRSVLNLDERLSAAFHGPGTHSPEYAAAAADAREHFARYAQPNDYDNVLLIDADGDVVFSLDPSPEMGVNLRTAPTADPALARVFDHVGMLLTGENSDYERDAGSGEQKAFVAAPIFKGGVLRGVVAFRINNRELFEIAGDYTGLGDTGETVIGRREGDDLILMTPTRHDPAAAFHRRILIDSRNEMPVQEATRGNSGIGPAWDYRGTEVLAAWQYLPALRCGLVVKMDAAEAFAPIRMLREAAVVLGCLVALVLVLLAPLVAHYLAAPIRHLIQTTREFSSGEFTHRAPVRSSDEIGNLAIVFNQMADTIQRQIATLSQTGHDLELRVEQRTADLEKANLALRTEVAEHRQAEESRRESEERFSGAFEYAPIGVALVSPDGHWLKVNRAVCELVGYSEAELLARTFQDITHPEDLEADLENVRRLLAGKIRSYQMEKRYIHKGGHFVPALLSVSLVRDARGRPRYFIAQIQDITESKEAEERLAYERDLLRTLLDNSLDHIYFKDAKSRFIKASRALARTFGVEADELVGRTDFDFFGEAHARTAFQDEQEIIRTGVPLIGRMEKEVWPNGREETWVLTTKMPFRNKDGEIIGTFGVSKDITALKQAEAKLADEQARLQFMFESMPVGVALARTYPDGRIERIINDAHLRICGLTREQDQTPGIYEKITHPEDAVRQGEFNRKLGAGNPGQYSLEKRYVRLDGGIVWVVYSFQRRMRDDGSFEELTTVVDITELKRSEEARRESQALYHSLVEQVPAGIFRKDAVGRFVFANPWYCQLKRMSEDQILGRTAMEIALEEASNPTAMWRTEFARQGQAHHEQILQTGQPIELEEIYQGLDGAPQYLHVVKSAVFGPDQKIIGTQGVVFDITELKRVEAAQRETSALLETLLQNATDDIYFKDLQSRFVYFSQSMLTHFRRTDPAEIKGHTDFDFFSEEHARPAFEAEQEIIRTGRAILNLEEKETLIDGGVTWALTSKMPWRDKAGHIIGTMGISKDITERKEIEHALSLTLERLQIAVKAGKAGTWDHDLLTGKVDWDEEMLALYGRTATDVAFGMERWYGAMHPEDRAPTIALYEAVQQGAQNSFDTEFRIHRGDDGSLRFIRAMGVVLRDESGRPVRMTGVNWDVTEERIREKKLADALAQEKELSEKAQAGSRAKSEFLAVMSHEIRTPMNGILGFSELLAAAPNLPADCRDYVKTISSSGEALLRIIDDILDFSRLEAGGLKIEPTLFSSRQILEDVHTLLAPRASEKHLEFRVAMDEGIPEHLWNDAGRLRQILLNLVGNALKFTAHGSITLGMRPSRVPLKDGEAAVDFFVRDTGTGIQVDKLDHVFEPFAQADSSISRRYGGTGLGLAISRDLVELMGGVLSVRSEVGEGSEFTVSLPTGMPHGAEPVATESIGEVQDETFAESHPLRILIAEDDPVNRKLLLLMLRKLGYEPLVARDGVEAVEVYRRERPDCILMDLQMPRKGGLQATIEIRELERVTPGGGHAYIAALTADIVAEDRRLCFDVGMDIHMNKPIKRAILAKTLEQASAAKFAV